jgi:outer membrane protein
MRKFGLYKGLLLFPIFLPSHLMGERLTLREAEQMAVARHPQLQEARWRKEADAAVPARVRAAVLPQVHGSLTGVLAEDDHTRILAGGPNNPSIYNRLGAGFGVSQMLLDFGRTRHRVESLRLSAEASSEAERIARAMVVLRVDRAYYAALAAQAVVRVARETVRERQLLVEQTSALARNKLKSELDVTFAKVSLDEALLIENEAVNGVRSATVNLCNALGLEESREFELVEEPMPETLPPQWDSVVATAVANRPELQRAKLVKQAAEEALRAESRLGLPAVSAFLFTGVAPLHIQALQNHWNAAAINVDIPVLNGGLFKARRLEATARVKEASEAARNTANNILRDVRLAYLDAVSAFERLQVTASLLEQAQQSLKLAQARYNLGLANIIELSQAQLNLTRAQISQARARFDYQALRAQLEYEMGIR